jgi:hypothetical protein
MYKAKQVGIILAIYLGISLLFLAFARDDGTLPVWLFQAIIGPLWHLASSFAIFNQVDVAEISNKNFLTGVASLCVWAISGLLVILWVLVEKRYLKTIVLVLLIAIWLTVGYFNIFLYGLFTV